MKPYHVLILFSVFSVSLVGCSNKEGETASENAGSTMAQKSENAGSTMAQKSENAGSTMAQKSENAAQETGKTAGGAMGSVTNTGVTAKIKNAINLSKLIDHKTSTINVDTTDDKVVLRGGVATQKEAQEAIRLAKLNAGTRTVVNQLKVSNKM